MEALPLLSGVRWVAHMRREGAAQTESVAKVILMEGLERSQVGAEHSSQRGIAGGERSRRGAERSCLSIQVKLPCWHFATNKWVLGCSLGTRSLKGSPSLL